MPISTSLESVLAHTAFAGRRRRADDEARERRDGILGLRDASLSRILRDPDARCCTILAGGVDRPLANLPGVRLMRTSAVGAEHAR